MDSTIPATPAQSKFTRFAILQRRMYSGSLRGHMPRPLSLHFGKSFPLPRPHSVRIMLSKPSFPATAGPRGPAPFPSTRALHRRSWKEPLQSSETKLAKRVAFLEGLVELFPAAATKQEHAPESNRKFDEAEDEDHRYGKYSVEEQHHEDRDHHRRQVDRKIGDAPCHIAGELSVNAAFFLVTSELLVKGPRLFKHPSPIHRRPPERGPVHWDVDCPLDPGPCHEGNKSRVEHFVRFGWTTKRVD